MQLSKNTSNGISKSFVIKVALILIIFISTVLMLDKIDFPTPNKEIEKIIPNEKLKVVK